MLDIIKKSMLLGAGLTLLTADKMKELIETLIREGDMSEKEARDAIAEWVDKKKKLMNDASSFWLYGVLSDEIEERVEKIVSTFLQQLHVPQRDEIEALSKRIEELEKH
jgi:poly(hydroxyalkanoate) granule-associated protein